ncbi:MAG: hypothetical protein WC792_06270 [Candidatus Micrarchaeia archaeon]|jgi:hypothetical protein
MASDDLAKFLEDIAEEEGYEEESAGAEKGGAGAAEKKGRRPDFRVLQPGVDRDCKPTYTEVGAMWRQQSRGGKDYYRLKIGNLRLLVFPNK